MDELSLLVDDSIDADVAAAESEVSPLPTPDFTGSLDYIDSLASRSALSVNRRDLPGITTALSSFDYLSPLLSDDAVPTPAEQAFRSSLDFRPLGDARRFDPEVNVRPPRALVRSSARVVSPSSFREDWVNPLDPDRPARDINRALGDAERRILRKPFAFSDPSRVVICIKRKVRRNVMHAFGFAGGHYFRKPRFNYWSRVIC